jgi:hypothetical protein
VRHKLTRRRTWPADAPSTPKSASAIAEAEKCRYRPLAQLHNVHSLAPPALVASALDGDESFSPKASCPRS